MIYEFQCDKCKIVIEEQRKYEENSDTTECPQCKGKAKKIASPFGFKINGFSSLNGYSHGNR